MTSAMPMVLELFDLPHVTPAQLIHAAQEFSSQSVASAFVERGLAEMQKPTFPGWVASAVLVAARASGQLENVLPGYQAFLEASDSTPKPNWHADYTDLGLQTNNLFAQSARFKQDMQEFDAEFQRVTAALGPPQLGRVLDAGCGGGLWTLHLAKLGYQIAGTDCHPRVIEAASRTAKEMAVSDKATFLVDDISASTIPSGFAARIICIGVTPALPDDDAFITLIGHLDRISGGGSSRRVILGQNRWGPSRVGAAREIVEFAGSDFARALNELNLLVVTATAPEGH